MKKKQKKLNKLFEVLGKAVAFILFSATCSTILVYGIMTATTL